MTIEQLIKEASDDFFESSHSSSDVVSDLEKVASLPYNEANHSTIVGMVKTASDRLKVVEEEVRQLTKVAEIRGVIDELMDKGLIGDFEIQEKTAFLLSKNDSELTEYKSALSFNEGNSGSMFDDGSVKTASINSGRTGMFDGIL